MQTLSAILTFITLHVTVNSSAASVLESCRHAAIWTLVPHEQHCHKFYVCDGRGQYEELSCSQNYHFSAAKQRCVPGNCSDVVTLKTCETSSVQRAADNCRRYLRCVNGRHMELSCSSGSYFYAGVSGCLPMDVTPQHQCSCLLPENSTVTNKHNCETYYRCKQGVAVLVQCPVNHYYEPSIGSCLWDSTGVCLLPATLPPMVNSEAQAWEECSKTGSVLVPHSSNCRKFYACVNNRAISMYCPVGQYYDAVRRSCSLDKHSKCSIEQTQLHKHEEPHKLVPTLTETVHVQEAAVQPAVIHIELVNDVLPEAAKQQHPALETEHSYDKLSSKFILA